MADRSVILLLSTLFSLALGKEIVPVLIWNTNQVQENVPAVSALQNINYATFQSKYLQAFKPTNILLFLQDALSVEDLSSHPTELSHVNQWMKQGHSLYLPNVEDPAHLAHDLPLHGYNLVVLEPGVPAAGLDLKQEDNNLVVVKLPSTLTNPSRHRAIQKADEVMNNVISKIGAQREFTVIFTGLKPSVEDHSEKYEKRSRVARAAKPSDTCTSVVCYYTVNCVQVYVGSMINFTFYDSTSGGEPEKISITEPPHSVSGHCYKTASSIFFKYMSLNIDFTFHLEQKGNYWGFDSVSVNRLDTENPVSKTLKRVSPDISSIPTSMSFSCSQGIYFSNSTDGRVDMTMDAIQIQGFAFGEIFAPAWDCVPFFTVPIWVSLLTSFLLLFILTIGLYVLSDIKTMDRFDDPKGQPIIVAVSE